MGRRSCCCGCSNGVLVALNVVVLFTSVLMLVYSMYLTFQASQATSCDRSLRASLLYAGAFLCVVSLLGLLGSCCRASCVLGLYLAVLFVLIVGLACFSAVTLVVTNERAGNAVSGWGYKDYRLGNYSHRLQGVVNDEGKWEYIESCLKKARVCGLDAKAFPLYPNEFDQKILSPLQTGCCSPSDACGIPSLNETSRASPLSHDSDCTAWSDDPLGRCFGCKSCKAGVLAVVQFEWRLLAFFNLVLLGLLVLVYCVGCCALRSSRRERYQRYRRGA